MLQNVVLSVRKDRMFEDERGVYGLQHISGGHSAVVPGGCLWAWLLPEKKKSVKKGLRLVVSNSEVKSREGAEHKPFERHLEAVKSSGKQKP